MISGLAKPEAMRPPGIIGLFRRLGNGSVDVEVVRLGDELSTLIRSCRYHSIGYWVGGAARSRLEGVVGPGRELGLEDLVDMVVRSACEEERMALSRDEYRRG